MRVKLHSLVPFDVLVIPIKKSSFHNRSYYICNSDYNYMNAIMLTKVVDVKSKRQKQKKVNEIDHILVSINLSLVIT